MREFAVIRKYGTTLAAALFALSLSGCATKYINPSYVPVYVEKTAVVEDKAERTEKISVLVMPFRDSRKIKDPSLVFKQAYNRIRFKDLSLMSYLTTALLSDLESLGVQAQQGGEGLDIQAVAASDAVIGSDIDFILAVDVRTCTTAYKQTLFTNQPYSQFDFDVVVWDVKNSKNAHSGRLTRQLMGEVKSTMVWDEMVRILLNNDLSVINADIAEILVDLGGNRN